MQQIISKIKTIFKSSCILSCFVGHPVYKFTLFDLIVLRCAKCNINFINHKDYNKHKKDVHNEKPRGGFV